MIRIGKGNSFIYEEKYAVKTISIIWNGRGGGL